MGFPPCSTQGRAVSPWGGGDVLRLYEVIFVLRPELEEEAIATLMEKFRNLIESRGGEITRLDKWGKRRLAYEIKKVREGIYMILHYKGKIGRAHV